MHTCGMKPKEPSKKWKIQIKMIHACFTICLKGGHISTRQLWLEIVLPMFEIANKLQLHVVLYFFFSHPVKQNNTRWVHKLIQGTLFRHIELIIRNGSESISFGTPPCIICYPSLVKTWEKGEDSYCQKAIGLGPVSSHVSGENEKWKKEKNRSQRQQEKCQGNGFPWDFIKGFRCIVKPRVILSSTTTIIIIIISSKRAVINIAPRCHINYTQLLILPWVCKQTP